MADPVDVHKVGLAKIRESEEFSDCKIICGPYHFNCHKVILSTQSEYFRTALKSGTFKEGESGVIELKAIDNSEDPDDTCDDPEIVKLMIEYFYHFDYLRDTSDIQAPPSTDISTAPKINLIEHAKVFAMAIKYHVDGLRDLSIIKFREGVRAHWDHEDFAHTIFIVYSSTADDVSQLRELVAETTHLHSKAIQAKDEVEAVVRGIADLAYDLLRRSRQELQKPTPSPPPSKILHDQGHSPANATLPEDGPDVKLIAHLV